MTYPPPSRCTQPVPGIHFNSAIADTESTQVSGFASCTPTAAGKANPIAPNSLTRSTPRRSRPVTLRRPHLVLANIGENYIVLRQSTEKIDRENES